MEKGDYQKILNQLVKVSGLSQEQVQAKIDEKREKLSGLISEEGAAQVIAAELGVSFEDQKFKIEELSSGMRKVNLIGKVIRIFPVREFTTKKGEQSKVVNLILADETSNIRVVLWDTHHIELIEKGEVAEEKVVEIGNASMRETELHLGSFSEFKLSSEVLGEVKTERVVKEKNILDFKIGEANKVRAFVVQAFEPHFFHVCVDCKKKVEIPEGQTTATSGVCAEHGSVACEKRAVMNVVVDDGTESIRAVMFHEVLNSIGIKDYENSEMLIQQRENLKGKEMFFSGNVRNNSYWNKPEFILNEAQEVGVEELLKDLEGEN